MKICYLFDIDLIERYTHPTFPKLPNHALMKMSAYFKRKGYTIKLIYDKRIPRYNPQNLYIGSALYSGNLLRFKARLKKTELLSHIHIGTPTQNCHITTIKGLKCDYTEYDEMLKNTNIKLDWYPCNIGYLTKGCIRQCKFCVNRNRTEIIKVNTLDEIYQKKGEYIELLDDNLFASDDAVKLLNQIAEFSKKHDVLFKLRNGLDCRIVSDEKVKALGKCNKAFETLHCAWDRVENTFIFNNIKKIRKEVPISLICYTLSGVNVINDKDLKRDLLGFFYRHYMLKKIGVRPYLAIFEDDTEKYHNPYLPIYKLIKTQFNFLQNSSKTSLTRQMNIKYTSAYKKIVEVLDEFSYLAKLTQGEILNLDDFDLKMKEIADYLKIKHYSAI